MKDKIEQMQFDNIEMLTFIACKNKMLLKEYKEKFLSFGTSVRTFEEDYKAHKEKIRLWLLDNVNLVFEELKKYENKLKQKDK